MSSVTYKCGCPQANHLPFLSLIFHICKMEIIKIITLYHVRIKWAVYKNSEGCIKLFLEPELFVFDVHFS